MKGLIGSGTQADPININKKNHLTSIGKIIVAKVDSDSNLMK